MDGVLLSVRLVVAVILVLAAVGKLRAPGAVARSAAELGLPSTISRLAGVALAPLELALAIGLLLRPTAWWAALLAGCLFLAFSVLVGANLGAGRRPPCACFGGGGHTPISGWTLARNVALTVAVGATVAFGAPGQGPDVADWLIHGVGSPERLAWLTTALAVLAAAAMAVLFLRRRPQPEPSTSAPPAAREWSASVGTSVPRVTLQDLDGRSQPLWDAPRGMTAVLVFVEAGCRPCRTLDGDIAAWRRELTRHRVTVIGRGTVRGLREAFPATLRTGTMLVDPQRVGALAVGVSGTPSVVLVDPEGRIRAGAAGPQGVRALVASLGEGDGAVPTQLPLGASLVGVSLPTTRGGALSLDALRGGLSLLVFWDPRCRFCLELLPRLLLWERDQGHDGVRLVLVVRTADDADVRLQGFGATALVDREQSLLRAVGGRGTPSAVTVDADGRVGSDLAAGGDGVLALAQRSSQLTAVARALAEDGRKLAAAEF